MPQRPDNRSSMVCISFFIYVDINIPLVCVLSKRSPLCFSFSGGCMGQNLAARPPGCLGKCSKVLTLLAGLFQVVVSSGYRKEFPNQLRGIKAHSHLVWWDLAGSRSKPQAGEAWMLSSALQKAVGYAGGRKPRDANGLPSSCCKPSSPASGDSFLLHLPLFLGGFPVSLISSR